MGRKRGRKKEAKYEGVRGKEERKKGRRENNDACNRYGLQRVHFVIFRSMTRNTARQAGHLQLQVLWRASMQGPLASWYL